MPLSQYHIPFNITGKFQLENIPRDSSARQKKVHFLQNLVEFKSTPCNLKRQKKVFFLLKIPPKPVFAESVHRVL